jgi:uncharacterized protein (DUF2236 family)
MEHPGRFRRPPRGGITWRLAGERLGLLAWPRAILLQIAHPLVAAGVAEHSTFRRSPIAPYVRLHATVRAMRQLTFGTDAQAEAALDGILRIHDRVHGTLDAGVGQSPAGTPYSAHDPALLLWVHATLLDSSVRVLGDLLPPLTPTERDAYCAESAPLALALGARVAETPVTWRALQEYMARELDSTRIAVGPQARDLAHTVLRPSLGWLAGPAQRAGELITLGALPERIRTQYGFAWTDRQERQRQRLLAFVRRLRRWSPDGLARWPDAR